MQSLLFTGDSLRQPVAHGLHVQDLRAGRRVSRGLLDRRRVVLLPYERTYGVPFPLLGVQLPGRVRKPVVPLLHEPPDPVHAAVALWRSALRLPAPRRPRLMDLTSAAAKSLARRSSRRQLFKFLAAGSLGAGLWLTRTDVSLGSISGCVGCGGGPCNPCSGVGPICTNAGFPCKTCQEAGGCPAACQTSGEWFCCLSGGSRQGCRFRCSECNCPPGCGNLSCHCFTNMPIPCAPKLHTGDQPCGCPPLAPVP